MKFLSSVTKFCFSEIISLIPWISLKGDTTIVIFAAVTALAAANLPTVIDLKAPQPYKFGYNIKDKTSQQFRQEAGNGAGIVTGSYGFADARGVQRQVNYVADGLGFRAQVNTNEPGTANQSPAAVEMNSNAPYAGGVVGVASPVVSQVVVPAVASPVVSEVAVPVNTFVNGYGVSSNLGYGNGQVILGNIGYPLQYTRYGF